MEFTQTENRLRKCSHLLISRSSKTQNHFLFLIVRDGDMFLSKEEVTDEMRRLQGVDKAFKAMDLNK